MPFTLFVLIQKERYIFHFPWCIVLEVKNGLQNYWITEFQQWFDSDVHYKTIHSRSNSSCNKMKNKTYHTVRQFQNLIEKYHTVRQFQNHIKNIEERANNRYPYHTNTWPLTIALNMWFLYKLHIYPHCKLKDILNELAQF